MNYRAEFKYHVTNLNCGSIVHSSNDETDAVRKAIEFTHASGNQYAILKEVARTEIKRVVDLITTQDE